MSIAFDPFSAEWRRDPYPVYRQLRDEAPIHQAPESGIWCVSRYDDVHHVLTHPELFSSRAMFTLLMNGGQEGPPPLTARGVVGLVRFLLAVRMHPGGFRSARNLISVDGDAHASMRNVVNRGFTPRRVASWENRIGELVAACMAKLERGEPFDLVRDLAIPLPTTIIAEMVGVETERLADFKRWSDAVIHNATGPGRAEPFNTSFMRELRGLFGYLRGAIARRRAEPGDDLISTILAEQEGDVALSQHEVAMFVVLLIIAGNETTTNLIGNAVKALLANPAELERVCDDPGLVPGLVEEVVRYDAPVQMVFRNTVSEVEIAGVRVPEGAFVAAMLGSANRDERRFEDPDRFDVGRNPQGHLGFGFGKHFCLGASLARLEAKLALEALVPELPRLESRGPDAELIESFLVRGPSRLELQPAA